MTFIGPVDTDREGLLVHRVICYALIKTTRQLDSYEIRDFVNAISTLRRKS